MAVARWIVASGGTRKEAAEGLRLSSRTLRRWSRLHKQNRLQPRLRGRRIEKLDYKTRTDILEVLDLMGPRVGMPTLKPLFPEVPRSALKNMLHRFRDVRLYYEQKGMYTLTWTRPGAVWAMDHKDRTTMPIDGEHKFVLANRDLGSNYQIDWLSVESKDAETANKVLEARYKEHGPPLVQKADWGFAADSTRELLKKGCMTATAEGSRMLWYSRWGAPKRGGVPVAPKRTEHQRLRREFVAMAGDAFDAMFDGDRQEQLMTMTQREDCVLEKGAELQGWLLARHLAGDPAATPAKSEPVACPKCGGAGVPDKRDTKPVPRRCRTRAGPQEFRRTKYRCPKCRKISFPPGRKTRPRP